LSRENPPAGLPEGFLTILEGTLESYLHLPFAFRGLRVTFLVFFAFFGAIFFKGPICGIPAP